MFVLLLIAVILQLFTRHIAVFLPATIPIVSAGMFTIFMLVGIFRPDYLKVSSLLVLPTLLSFVDVQQGFLGFGDRTILLYGIMLSVSLSYLNMVPSISNTYKKNTVFITFLCIMIGIGLGIGNFIVFPNHFFFLGTEISLKIISTLLLFGVAEELWLRRLVYTQSENQFGSGPAILITTLSAATLGITGTVTVYWLIYLTHLLLTLLYSQTKSLRLSIVTNLALKITYYIFTLTISNTIISPFTL